MVYNGSLVKTKMYVASADSIHVRQTMLSLVLYHIFRCILWLSLHIDKPSYEGKKEKAY